MNSEEIKKYLTTKVMGSEVEYHDIIGSTNNAADDAGKSGKDSGYLVVADRQDAGRGSRGRNWISPAGHNIFMSLMIRPQIPMDKVSGLTLVMAISVSEAVEDILYDFSYSEKLPGIKWPNDVVLNGRKICGILTELHPEADGSYYVVIGVGINVNQPGDLFSDEIKDMAGSVFSETGKKTDRSKLIALCMKHFEDNFEKYEKTMNLSLLKDTYEKRLLNINKQVRVLDPLGEYEATALGISDEGCLIVRSDDGEVKNINAGEVSIRGLYGYT
ncbi:biotin--[acetyl-CoA-carboxylase] ligase, partial [Butyrivibrio sp. NC2002]|uniref:biotin--[acetyl-CoA-carboxylase] ligase n=1 Tax=Butyrivibrio sp. NC2002 TaxID=1410610 RepID=UPI00055C16EB